MSYKILFPWNIEKKGILTGERVEISIAFEFEQGYPAVTGGSPDDWEPGCPDLVYDYEFDVVSFRNASGELWVAEEMVDEDKTDLLEEFLEKFESDTKFAEVVDQTCIDHVYSFNIPDWQAAPLCGYPDDIYTY